MFGCSQADKEIELEKEIARGNQQDRKMLIEESFLHANSQKPVRFAVALLPSNHRTLADNRVGIQPGDGIVCVCASVWCVVSSLRRCGAGVRCCFFSRCPLVEFAPVRQKRDHAVDMAVI